MSRPTMLALPDAAQRARIARRRRRLGRDREHAVVLDELQHAVNTQMNGIVGTLDVMQQADLAPEQRTLLAQLQGAADRLLERSAQLLCRNVKGRRTDGFTSVRAAAVRTLLVGAGPDRPSPVWRILQRRRVTVDACATPQAALKALEQATAAGNPYHVALLEQALPGLDGETLGAALGGDARHRDTLLALISDRHGPADAGRLAQAGFSAWLPHAPSPAALAATLDTMAGWAAGAAAPGFLNDGMPAPQARPGANRPPSCVGRRVLAVDDNRVNLQVAERLLAHFGCRVDTAESGEQALALAAAHAYDLILMDCQMPGLDGYQTTARLRAAGGENAHVPIVGWSARTRRGERDTCLAIGMDDFMPKPVRLQALGALLARWLPAPDAAEAQPVQAGPDDELLATQQMFGDDFAELANLYRADTPQRIAALRQATAENDLVAFIRMAHAICGSSASIGATALSSLCRELEIRARNGIMGDAQRIDAVADEYARVERRLRGMLPAGTSEPAPGVGQ